MEVDDTATEDETFVVLSVVVAFIVGVGVVKLLFAESSVDTVVLLVELRVVALSEIFWTTVVGLIVVNEIDDDNVSFEVGELVGTSVTLSDDVGDVLVEVGDDVAFDETWESVDETVVDVLDTFIELACVDSVDCVVVDVAFVVSLLLSVEWSFCVVLVVVVTLVDRKSVV